MLLLHSMSTKCDSFSYRPKPRGYRVRRSHVSTAVSLVRAKRSRMWTAHVFAQQASFFYSLVYTLADMR